MKRYDIVTISGVVRMAEQDKGGYVLHTDHLREQRRCWRNRFVQSFAGYALGCLMTSLAALAWWAIQ